MAMTISEQNYINDAINRARGAYNNAIETARRNAERMGLNPNSGKFSAIENAAQFDVAAATAATANEASSNWLKTAQAQANEDEAMRLKYSALDLEREQLDHKIWLDKENLDKEVQAAKGYLSESDKANNKANNGTPFQFSDTRPEWAKKRAKGLKRNDSIYNYSI